MRGQIRLAVLRPGHVLVSSYNPDAELLGMGTVADLVDTVDALDRDLSLSAYGIAGNDVAIGLRSVG